MSMPICEIENCNKPIRIKKLGMCQMHETRQRNYGDPNYKSQRKSILPLNIPEGEVVWDYQKARKILMIVSNIEKMIMCGYFHNWASFSNGVFNQIGTIRGSSSEFYEKYVSPILYDKPELMTCCSRLEEISNLVNKIIEKEKVDNTTWGILCLMNLKSFGIKNENKEFSFIDTDKKLGEKCCELNIDLENEKDYEICHKLKIHYNRYKKIINTD